MGAEADERRAKLGDSQFAELMESALRRAAAEDTWVPSVNGGNFGELLVCVCLCVCMNERARGGTIETRNISAKADTPGVVK